jgi:tRNA threonylcarbamoyladenosine biosynthesis protein TsaB
MLLLATDTSGKQGSIALAQCDGNQCTILEVVQLIGGTFSAQLVPQIAALLAKHGFIKRDLGGFAVASGPGSFTGLRVGLAAIKALAEVLEKPIAAVSLLEVVVRSVQSDGTLLAALDAGRNEVYLGEYEVRSSDVDARREWLVGREECFASAAQKTLATPDVFIAEEARARGLEVKLVEHPGSDLIAKIGWQKIRSGKTVSPQDLDANYIRRSDAEIFAPNKS